MTAGVVAHVTCGEAEDWSKALRNVGNLLDDQREPSEVVVVVHGDALPMLLSGSPAAAAVSDRRAAGVSFRACANTLAGRGEDASALLEGVTVVPSGVAEVVRLQRDGWAYLKLP